MAASASGTPGRGSASARSSRRPPRPQAGPTPARRPGARLRPGRPARRGRVGGLGTGEAPCASGTSSGRKLIRPPLHLPPRRDGLAFSPDGSQLAIAFGARRGGRHRPRRPDGVEVRDVRSGELLARLPADEVGSVAFSPDGRLLAGGQVDGSTSSCGRPTAGGGWGRRWLSARGRLLGGLLPRRPHAGHLARRRRGRALGRRVPAADRLAAAGPAGAWMTARFTPDGARLFARLRERDRDPLGGRSGGLEATGLRSSPAAASRPSSGRSSSPSRTTVASAPPADDRQRGARPDRA